VKIVETILRRRFLEELVVRVEDDDSYLAIAQHTKHRVSVQVKLKTICKFLLLGVHLKMCNAQSFLGKMVYHLSRSLLLYCEKIKCFKLHPMIKYL
jgi:hypothetical protein